jgi:hypothetical protein
MTERFDRRFNQIHDKEPTKGNITKTNATDKRLLFRDTDRRKHCSNRAIVAIGSTSRGNIKQRGLRLFTIRGGVALLIFILRFYAEHSSFCIRFSP